MELIEDVSSFTFLGTNVNKESSCKEEICRRLTLEKTALMNLTEIWKSWDVEIKTEMRLGEALVFPVTLYGCEAVRKSDRRKIDAFEVWCWRRMLRISWMGKVTNKAVLKCVGNSTSLKYHSHLLRVK